MNKQKGISQIVVMVIMLVLAIALPITTKLVQQSQENRSKAFANYRYYILLSDNKCHQTSNTYEDGITCGANLFDYMFGLTTGICYSSLSECNAAVGGDSPPSVCDSGETRWMYNGSSCVEGPVASCESCSGSYPCYGTQLGCTGAHPTSPPSVCDSGETRWMYNGSSCVEGPVASCESCSGSYPCYGTQLGCTGAHPTSPPSVCDSGETRWMYNGSSCVEGPVASCESCSGSYPCYGTQLGCTGAHPTSPPSVCDSGETRWMYNGSSCVEGPVASCESCSGSYPCYGTQLGCTGAHPPTAAVNGACSTTKNTCTAGTLSDTADTSTQYKWNCVGTNGGTTANCTANITTAAVNGACSTTKNTCTAGTLSDTADTSTQYKWNCVGTNGGTTANCTANITTAAVNGACSTTKNTCTAGTLSDTADTSTQYKWNCVGTNGGTTANCTANITAAAGDSTVNIKLALAGVKLNNGQCATNWPVALKIVDSAGNNVMDKVFSGVPTQTTSVNSKGEIIYDFNIIVSGVPEAGVNKLAFFLTGSKHIPLKYGKNNQTGWYSTLAGDISLTKGTTNSFDFSKYPLLAGDVTGDTAGTPDGKIDGRDFSYIKEKANALASGSAGTSVAGDIDGNCQVNSGDVRLVKESLIEINGQTY